MRGEGPYLQRVEMLGGTWFARAIAITASGQAVAREPHGAEAFVSRGNALQELRRFEEALASYDRVISLRPDHADAFYNRGIALMQLNRLEEARASYDRVIALRPDYVRAYNNRGNVFQVMKC